MSEEKPEISTPQIQLYPSTTGIRIDYRVLPRVPVLNNASDSIPGLIEDRDQATLFGR